MSIIGDYGHVQNGSRADRYVTTERRSQVFQATHDREGSLLPSRLRSFISFSFGGRNIEDFNLIACCEGDTMTRRAYAEFEDLTSEYDIMDGQYYHGTHYKPNTLSLRLVSDDLDQKQLDEFLYWFQGGRTRELILAEHPNRAIMARVASAPEIDVLPFEKQITINFSGNSYQTSTTLYKGFIKLELVSDMPFWYAKQNLFIQDDNGITQYNGKSVYADDDTLKEALKISYEDTVPLADIVATTMHFGENHYASIMNENTAYSIIAYRINQSEYQDDVLGYFMINDEYWKGARTMSSSGDVLGRIAGAAILDNSTLPISIASGETDYVFFYGGNAPSPTILSFDVNFQPLVENNPIDCFYNSDAPSQTKLEYSTLSIISNNKKDFDFTITNIMVSWNKAKTLIDGIDLAKTYQGDLADTFRDQIRHPAVRAWAIGIINYLKKLDTDATAHNYITEAGLFTAAGKQLAQEILPKLFMHPGAEQIDSTFDVSNRAKQYADLRTNRNWEWNDASFEFNAETCEATGKFYYWQSAGIWNVVWEVLGETEYPPSRNPTNTFIGHASYRQHSENVGDMLRSNWLIIEEHNKFDDNGQVVRWTDTYEGRQHSHYLVHNAPATLKNLKLTYKNMYL